MNHQYSWSQKLSELIENGLYADAEILLEHSLRTHVDCPEDETIAKLTNLVQICYTRLRHDKASDYADQLQRLAKVKTDNWWRTLVLSYVICLAFLWGATKKIGWFDKVYRRLFGDVNKPLSWNQANILLFGNYWQNIKKSLCLSLFQYYAGDSEREYLLSTGFTAYTLSYAGHNVIGNRTLQKVVNKAKQLNNAEIIAKLNPHLAIAYGMSAQTERALTIYHEMESARDLPSFYRLVVAANKIGLSLADKNPAAAQEAINLCFNESFSLANSANHVQIYGGQAILYALANRPEEAESFMHKSFLSAENCGGPLNFLFFYRMEALMWLILKRRAQCQESIRSALKYLHVYGGTKWHYQEICRIDCINDSQKKPSIIVTKYYLHKFLFKSFLLGNVGLIRKALRIYWKFLFNSQLNYWHEKEVVGFFRHYFRGVDDTKTSHLGKISLRIASAFIDSYQSLSVFDRTGLEDQIKKSLPVNDVVFASSKEDIVQKIREKYTVSDLIIVSDKSDRVRIKCADFGFFICVESPSVNTNSNDLFFVGILMQDVDIQSEELIEAFLRVILTQYIFNSALMLEEKKRFDVEKRAATNQTIASTVQMLAHDVRRPFSMVQGILDVLASTDDPQDAQEFAVEHLPEIKKAIAHVSNMLSDIIEVGTSAKLDIQSLSPVALIESALLEHFRYNETANVAFQYQFRHQYNVQVDATKVSRVVTNIIMNALQAMSFSGKLWFTTNIEIKNDIRLAKFTIGNSGSFIPSSEIEKLFEPYYTKGKKSGTGLGLAIADKVIREHGGDIWCTSCEEVGTEFHFTLPVDEENDGFKGFLFPHSSDIYHHYQPVKEKDAEQRSSTEHEEENKFEQLAIKTLAEIDWPLSILITDDEPFYRSILKEQLLFNTDISSKVEVTLSPSGEQSLRLCEDKQFDLIIMDVDFGPAMANGFDTVKEMRKRGIDNKIIIHSNRGALQYQAMSIEAGADLFIPKPMSRAVFLKIIVSVLQDRDGRKPASLSA